MKQKLNSIELAQEVQDSRRVFENAGLESVNKTTNDRMPLSNVVVAQPWTDRFQLFVIVAISIVVIPPYVAFLVYAIYRILRLLF